jgi:adenylate cyclase class IV
MQNSSNIEREEKFEVVGKINVVYRLLEQHGFSKVKTVRQKDVYWDDSLYTITNKKRGLRVRYVADELDSFEFKSLFINEAGEKVVEEVGLLNDGELNELKLQEILTNRFEFVQLYRGANLEEILLSYGLKPAYSINKTREIYREKNGNIEISVDKIECLNPHIEIEYMDGNPQIYENIVEKFKQIDIFNPTTKGYVELVMGNTPGIRSSEEFERLFAENPKWNVMHGEESIVEMLFVSR